MPRRRILVQEAPKEERNRLTSQQFDTLMATLFIVINAIVYMAIMIHYDMIMNANHQ